MEARHWFKPPHAGGVLGPQRDIIRLDVCVNDAERVEVYDVRPNRSIWVRDERKITGRTRNAGN